MVRSRAARALGFGDLHQDAPGVIEIASATVGERDRARGALQKSRAEMRLQCGHESGRCRRRKPQLSRGGRKAAEVGDGNEDIHGFQAVHLDYCSICNSAMSNASIVAERLAPYSLRMAIPSDVAFSPSVKAAQTRLGSRKSYARMEENGGWETQITDELADFIGEQTSFFFATASAAGQPYVQHRGGPKKFLKVVDKHTLSFADYPGNRQYISIGNLAENPKVQLFLIDYAHRRRVKIWGEAKVVEKDGERSMVVTVSAWDVNCPQYIPQRLEAEDVRLALAARDEKIATLEARIKELEHPR